MDPIVSIVIPVYNAERSVHRAVETALAQTEHRIEVIAVDDGSSDRSVSVLGEVDDPRLHVEALPANAGACAARNVGLRLARGEWVTFADADDWMDPARLEQMVATAHQARADVIADDVFWTPASASPGPEGGAVDADGNPLTLVSLFSASLRSTLPRRMGPAEFVLGNLPGRRRQNLGLMKPLFRRSFLTQHQLVWDESVRYGQDTAFYTDVLAAGAAWVLTPSVGYYYVRNVRGISKRAPAIEAVTHRLDVNRQLHARHRGDVALARALDTRARALRRTVRTTTFYERIETLGVIRSLLRHPRGAAEVLQDMARSLWTRAAGKVSAVADTVGRRAS